MEQRRLSRKRRRNLSANTSWFDRHSPGNWRFEWGWICRPCDRNQYLRGKWRRDFPDFSVLHISIGLAVFDLNWRPKLGWPSRCCLPKWFTSDRLFGRWERPFHNEW